MAQSGYRRLLKVAALCLTAATAGALSPDPPSLFLDPISTVGRDPWGLLAYDLNADGILDVVSANAYAGAEIGTVSVLMGRGDGTFLPERRYPAGVSGTRPWGLDAGDLTGDGHADIVVCDFLGPAPLLLRGGADGEFTPDDSAAAQPECAVVLIRDFDGDGRNDLALSDWEKISVRLGRSDGTLSDPIDFHTWPLSAYAMSAGDLDHDGVLDLAISTGYADGMILRGTGDGGFLEADSLNESTDVDLGDLNEDGWLDIVTANRQGQLFVRFNAAGNGFSSPFVLHAGQDYLDWPSTAVADINGDGVLDVALGGFGSLSVFLGTGGGVFDGSSFSVSTASGFDLASGDFNRDGRDDLAVVHPMDSVGETSELDLHFGQTDGSLGLQSILVKASLPITGFAFGDLDEDGNDDIVAASRGSHPRSLGGLSVYHGGGRGAFTAIHEQPVESNPYELALGDLDGDGHLDVVMASTGVWECIASLPLPSCYLVTPSDIRSYLGQGDGTFELRSTFDVGNSGSVVLADFDLDGALDLARTSQTGVVVRHGAGDGTFGSDSVYRTLSLGTKILSAADLNGDERPDLVVSEAGGLWLLLNHEGGFALMPLLSTQGVSGLTVSDLDGDDLLDIAALGEDRFWLMYGHGDGSFDSVVVPSADYQVGLGSGDFDGDGHIDLATSRSGLNIYRGGGGAPYTTPLRFRSYEAGSWIVTHDIDRNGRLDIASSSDRGIRIHLNQLRPPNSPPVAVASAPALPECTSPAGAAVALDGSASSDDDSSAGTADDIVSYEWFEQTQSGEVPLGTQAVLTVTLPLGAHTVGLRVTDAAGASSTAEMRIEVVDTTPPSLAVSSSWITLWPANHRLVDVRPVLAATDLCGPATAAVASVASSEPEDAPGGADGVTRPDVVVAGGGSVWLRAERDARGPGRVYTIQVSAMDASGLTTTGSLEVRVPHDLHRPR